MFFNLGVDEHGLKLLTTARTAGKSPEQYLDALVPHWVDFCSKYNIHYDFFYRTSSRDHHRGAQEAWKICYENGDIYKRHYEGLYCIGCEAFLLERELIDGACPSHGTKPVRHSEENYFFRLSKYSSKLLAHLEHNPDFLQPLSRRQELLNFLKTMEDISISRSREALPWGIEVPGDPAHTMYVWFDALINYIRVLGFNTDMERFHSWWPGVQLCGPDNLRFQGAIWQGMLASLGLPFTRRLLVHGTIYGPDGHKMSKTRGNVVAPLEQYEKYGSDACRFYMLGTLRPYADSSYREEDLKSACNAHLANNYGNLLNRLVHLGNKRSIDFVDHSRVSQVLRERVEAKAREAESAYEAYELSEAVGAVNELVSFGNRYIHETEPWRKDSDEAEEILSGVAYLLRVASKLYEPIIPDGTHRAIQAIERREKIILYPRL